MVLGAETAVRKSGSGFDSALWGLLGAPRGGAAVGPCKSTAQKRQRSPDRSFNFPDLHQATRCVALVTETRLNVIDG